MKGRSAVGLGSHGLCWGLVMCGLGLSREGKAWGASFPQAGDMQARCIVGLSATGLMGGLWQS